MGRSDGVGESHGPVRLSRLIEQHGPVEQSPAVATGTEAGGIHQASCVVTRPFRRRHAELESGARGSIGELDPYPDVLFGFDILDVGADC